MGVFSLQVLVVEVLKLEELEFQNGQSEHVEPSAWIFFLCKFCVLWKVRKIFSSDVIHQMNHPPRVQNLSFSQSHKCNLRNFKN